MKVILKVLIWGIFSLVLLSNITYLGIGTVFPHVSGAVSLNPQSSSISNQTIVLAQSGTSNCVPTQGFGELVINKVVRDSQGNVVTGTSLNGIPLTFAITVNNGGAPSFLPLINTVSQCIPIAVGNLFTVTETGAPPQLSFTPQIPFVACSGTMNTAQTVQCTITNTITGTGSGSTIPFSATSPSQTQGQTSQPVIPQSGSITSPVPNPPFQTCQANAPPTGVTLGGITFNGGVIANTAVTRLPSSATYTLKGSIPLGQVRAAMNSLGANSVTIQMLQDLHLNDQLMLAVGNPQISGKVLVQSNDGLRQKVISFNVVTTRTDCKFITVIKPSGSIQNNAVAPLGQLGKSKTLDVPPNNYLLGGAIVATNQDPTNHGQGIFPPVLNPPWAACIPPTSTTFGDSVAIYNVRGSIPDLTQMSGHSLVLEVTADLVQANFDNAKITDNNNPFVIVNVIADEGQKTVHRINFNFDGLWTDCKQVATSNSLVFQPITGETSP